MNTYKIAKWADSLSAAEKRQLSASLNLTQWYLMDILRKNVDGLKLSNVKQLIEFSAGALAPEDFF